MATSADSIEELNKSFLNFMLSAEDVEKATEEIYEDLVDEVLMGFVFDCHRNLKFGIAEAEEGIINDTDYNIVDRPGFDVFGEPLTRKTGKCTCPNCDHIVTANRFATHLERCLGMGRNTITRAMPCRSGSSKNVSDDEKDDDWCLNKRRKRAKSTKKPTKKPSANQKDESDDVSTSKFLTDFVANNNNA